MTGNDIMETEFGQKFFLQVACSLLQEPKDRGILSKIKTGMNGSPDYKVPIEIDTGGYYLWENGEKKCH